MTNLKYLRYWCFKVLPLVYDDSLSYYEVLCKVTHYINELINNQKELAADLDALEASVAQLQKWVDEFDTTFIESVVEQWLATSIFVGISDAGYIIYWIPENWKTITFNTTGLDIDLPMQPEYGHLVLSY